MVAKEGIIIVVRENAKFLIYVHDHGEEYFMHYDIWPGIPSVHQVQEEVHSIEIDVKKEVEVASNNCIDGAYSYYG